MGKPYSEELDQIGATLLWAAARDFEQRVAPPADNHPIVVIGSGGSFTAAEFGARVFQASRRKLCIAASPFEYIQRVSEYGRHHAVLLSAEGKNTDIRTAAVACMQHALSTSAIIFQVPSALATLLNNRSTARVLEVAAPWGKDGYLATNSLVASMVALAHAAGLSVDAVDAIKQFGTARRDRRIRSFANEVASGRRVLAIHGSAGATAAIDLESRFAESAFGSVQRADLRQFAHGRHIQLAQGKEDYAIVAYVGGAEIDLWAATQSNIPLDVPVVSCVLPDDLPSAALQGVLFTFALVESVGEHLGVDPGQPEVPEFARRIHALDPASHSVPPSEDAGLAKLSLMISKGASRSQVVESLDTYVHRLTTAELKGLVLDFDGTCCETKQRLEGIKPELANELVRLLDAGMPVAFASGRGDSLHEDLRKKLPERVWHRVLLGCHSGSSSVRLSAPWLEGPLSDSMASLTAALADLAICRPAFKIRIHAGQFTIEAKSKSDVQRAFLVACAVARAYPGWRVFRSAHSIDLLAPEANKHHVVEWLAREADIDVETQLLRIGDRGEAFGNDSELLGRGLALSVDGVSPDPQACWILGNATIPASARALAYLRAIRAHGPHLFKIDAATLANWSDEAKRGLQRLLGGNP